MNDLKRYFIGNYHLLIIVLVAILGFWQIAFLQNSLKWDMVDCWLPWRFFIGECLQNNMLPWWNPYQQFGYPIHADLQGPSWYPEALIIGKLFGHGIYTLHFTFVFYVFLGGWGMYQLSKSLDNSQVAALICAIGYMLSGFFVSHTQHFYSIISAAWIPFLILYYLKMAAKPNLLNSSKVAMVMFMMITGGNQTFTIISSYLLLTFFIFHLVKSKSKNKKLKWISTNLSFFIITALLCSTTIVILKQVFPYIERLSGMSFEEASFNPFTYKSLISFFTPFGVGTFDSEFFGTGLSMRNSYFGIILLCFFIWVLPKKKNTNEYIFLAFGSICLLLSFGQHFPLYKIFHSYIPLLNLFRFPSYFTLFTIITFLLLAAKGITNFIESFEQYKKSLIVVLITLIGVLVILVAISISKISFGNFSLLTNDGDLFQKLYQSTVYENIFVHAIIQLGILSGLVLFLIKIRKKDHLKIALVATVLLEMAISTQLNIRYTSIHKKSPTTIKEEIDKLPNGFSIPSNYKMTKCSDISGSLSILWRNTNVYHKKISYDGFNTFWFKNYNTLFDSLTPLKNAVLENSLIYLSDQLIPFNKYDSLTINKSTIYIADSNYANYSDIVLTNLSQDTSIITSFSPTEILVKTKTSHNQLITLLQSNYTGWQVLIDDIPVEHFTSNCLFISAMLPAGEHLVKFKYENNSVLLAFVISCSVLSIILFLNIHSYFISTKTS
ncbi:MAG: hypothetical protein COC01_03070 [Bacteroidetes bacterium]|nr:MAG: hypothetical protein COC01_03070 [Bacteroidota bacterium]